MAEILYKYTFTVAAGAQDNYKNVPPAGVYTYEAATDEEAWAAFDTRCDTDHGVERVTQNWKDVPNSPISVTKQVIPAIDTFVAGSQGDTTPQTPLTKRKPDIYGSPAGTMPYGAGTWKEKTVAPPPPAPTNTAAPPPPPPQPGPGPGTTPIPTPAGPAGPAPPVPVSQSVDPSTTLPTPIPAPAPVWTPPPPPQPQQTGAPPPPPPNPTPGTTPVPGPADPSMGGTPKAPPPRPAPTKPPESKAKAGSGFGGGSPPAPKPGEQWTPPGIDNLTWAGKLKEAGAKVGETAEMLKEKGVPGAEGLKSKGEMLTLTGRAMAGDPVAIAQLAEKAIDEMKERFAAAGKAVKSLGDAAAASGGHIEESAAPLWKGMESFGKALGSDSIQYLAKFGNAITDSVGTVRRWADQMHYGNMQFAEYSASMALVQARQQVRDIFYEKERGDARSDTAEQLAQARTRFRQATAGLEDMVSNFFNDKMSKFIDTLSEKLEKILPKADTTGEAGHAHEWLWTMGGTRPDMWDEFRKPRRFR